VSQTAPFCELCATDEAVADCLVIDGHCHVDFWIGAYCQDRHIEGIIEVCDELGVDKLCINYGACPEMRVANDVVARGIRKYPNRVVGICYINYYEGGAEVQQAELKRCFDELGFMGIKVGNFHDIYPQTRGYFELEDPLQPTWEFAQERGASILCHGVVTYDIARRYPGANFIVAHGGGAPEGYLRVAELPNTYCDTASTGVQTGALELLCEKVGAERIVYGSDLPAFDLGHRLGVVMAAQISESDRELILGQNMQRLLNNVK